MSLWKVCVVVFWLLLGSSECFASADLECGIQGDFEDNISEEASCRGMSPSDADSTMAMTETSEQGSSSSKVVIMPSSWSVSKALPPLNPGRKTILFVAHFFVSTDVNHMLLMAEELRIRGHDCYFIVMEPYVKRVEKAGFKALGTPNILQGEDFESIKRAFRYTSRETHWFTYIRKYVYSLVPIAVKYWEPSVEAVLEWMKEHGRPDLMVCSKASEGPIDVAWHYDIPMSLLFTMPLGGMVNNYEDVIAAPDANLWGAVADQSSLFMRARKYIGRFLMLVNPVTAEAGLKLAYSRYKYGFNPFAIPGDHWRKSMIISPWSMGIDLARPLRPLTQLVGFMTNPLPELPSNEVALASFSEEDRKHLQYLNSKDDGVVFCAFGSLAVLTQEWFDELVLGMDMWARTQGPSSGGIIAVNDLSLKAGLNVDNVPETVMVTGWINQQLYLAHPNTQAFITHGGLGSLGEAVHARVPMLVFPLFFDQPNNAHRLEEAGVALKLHFREEAVIAPKVASKLKQLTSEISFQHNLDRQFQISQRSGGVTRAADLLEDVLLLDGNMSHMIPITERVGLFTRTNLDLFVVLATLLGFLIFQTYKYIRRRKEQQEHSMVPKSIEMQYETSETQRSVTETSVSSADEVF